MCEALCCFQFCIQHLDERNLLVKSDPGMIVETGKILAIKEEGMPDERNPLNKGNLYIEFNVEFPKANSLQEHTVKVSLVVCVCASCSCS